MVLLTCSTLEPLLKKASLRYTVAADYMFLDYNDRRHNFFFKSNACRLNHLGDHL